MIKKFKIFEFSDIDPYSEERWDDEISKNDFEFTDITIHYAKFRCNLIPTYSFFRDNRYFRRDWVEGTDIYRWKINEINNDNSYVSISNKDTVAELEEIFQKAK